MKNLFPYYKEDQDKQLLYKLDANLIYCTDLKQRVKILLQMKMILKRREDLKSEVFELSKNEIINIPEYN